jgi:hypothetical protein
LTRAGDVVLTISNQPVSPAADIVDLLRSYPTGGPCCSVSSAAARRRG